METFLQKLGRGLLWLELFWIVALTPSLLFRDLLWDPWLHPWLILSLFLFWPLRLVVTRRIAPPSPLLWPAFLLLLWTPIGLLNSVDWERSWHAIGFVALGIALLFACLNWPPLARYPWLIAVMLGGIGIGLALLGPAILPDIPQKIFLFSEDLTTSRPADFFNAGETVNSNVLAGGLLLPIPLLAALGLRCNWLKRRWLPPLILIPTLVMLTTLLLVQSRGAYLAVALSLLIVVTLRWPWAGLIALIAGVAAGVALSLNGVLLFAAAIGSSGSITSLSGRWEVWERALQAFGDFILTGIGIGTFDLVIPALYPYIEIKNVIPHAHNLFLQIGVDLGLPGMLLYLWLFGSACWIFIDIVRNGGQLNTVEVSEPSSRRARQSQRHQLRRQAALRWALAVGGLAALVALLIHGLVDAVMWGTKLSFIGWLLFALAGALYTQEHQNNETTFDLQSDLQR